MLFGMTDVVQPGWYPAPGEPGFERQWDGTTWTDERRPVAPGSTGPGGLAIAGFVLSIIGFFSAFLGGIIITLPALFISLAANKRRKSGLATAGWIIAAVGTVLAVLITVSRVLNS